MPQGNPRPGERYRHFKNKLYQIVCLAHHSETDERLVVYQALYGEFGICARPYDMFISEVDHEKYPEVQQKYRFEYVETDSAQPYWVQEETIKAEVESESTEEAPESTEEAPASEVIQNTKEDSVPVSEPEKEPIKVVVSETAEDVVELPNFKKAEVVFRENLPKEDRIVIKVDKMERREFEPVKDVPPLKVEEPRVVEPVVVEPAEEGQANPWLLKFLDAETYDDKYMVLSQMYREIDDKLIDDIAVCMDIAIPEGNLQERFMQLKQCLRTKQKYEGTRS